MRLDFRHRVGGSTAVTVARHVLRGLPARSSIYESLTSRRETGGSIRAALALHWVATEWIMIIGSITTKDVLLNASTIVRSFGLSTYARCLRALLTGRRTTFLELAWQL